MTDSLSKHEEHDLGLHLSVDLSVAATVKLLRIVPSFETKASE